MESSAATVAARQIWDLSYPDFVAYIDQENAPPGGRDTIQWWAEAASINAASRVLDLACSTGLSSRHLAALTGCAARGLDRSRAAIARANARAIEVIGARELAYATGDACALPYEAESFTHVVAGSCFGFIEDRAQALAETERVLAREGQLCISTFHYVSSPPAELLGKVSRCVGYSPDVGRTWPFWRSFFESRFDLVTVDFVPLQVHPVADVCAAAAEYVLSIRHRFDELPDLAFDAVYKRLLRDRVVFNEHRRHQECARSVWRRR
jgi:SAM-dependent methyltransferase